MEKTRINVFITPEVKQKIVEKAEKLGMSQSKLASLAIMAGIDAITLAFNPDWKKCLEAIAKDYDEHKKTS